MLLHATRARQILYGGAAGGGKSTCLRWDAIAFCLANPGCQAYLFRKTRPELEQNHIVWIKRELSDPRIGKYSDSRNAYEFSNGSILHFCYCERDADVYRYQGAEIHWLGIDEAAHLTEFQIQYLKTRNRLGSWRPDKDGDRLPRFVMGSNPGGPGHNFLKLTFIDPGIKNKIFFDTSTVYGEGDKGWPSIFIPARMSDNVYIDPNYQAQFAGLPTEYAEALRDGNWDAVVGQALSSLSRAKHQLRAFRPPRHWTKFMSLDWGTASPFSVGWYCVSEGATLASKAGWPERWLPPGAVIRFMEWYGWNGKANQGLRLPPQAVARGIIDREEDEGLVMDYRVADNEMWAQKSGPAAIEWFPAVDPRLVFQKARKDRRRNFQEITARLAGNPEYFQSGHDWEDPMFFVTENCVHFWRTVPTLTFDEVDPEKGPGDKASDENHCLVGDTIVYTRRGPAKLRGLPKFGEVLTPLGYRPFVNLGVTAKNTPVWTIVLPTGEQITATQSHRFLCSDLRYRRVDELTPGDWVYHSDVDELCQASSSTARRIGNAAIITLIKLIGYTETCGNSTMGLCRGGITSITKTATALTTPLKTWSFCRLASISATTCNSQTASPMPNGIWRQGCAPKPGSGTGQTKVLSGTAGRERPTQRYRPGFLSRALSVVLRGWQKREAANIARMRATSGSFAVEIQDMRKESEKRNVYNLHVVGPNNFVVQGGAVSHNCYDEVAYALRSRPFILTEQDRFIEEWGDEMAGLMKKGVDPYATA